MNPAVQPSTEQHDIINYDGNLVAIARPGSGKTFVMAEKIRRVLSVTKAFQGVIAISYTNKASNELRRRVRTAGTDIKQSFIGTIDGFCDREIILPFLPHLWGSPHQDVSIVRMRDLPDEESSQFVAEEHMSTEEVLSNNLGVYRSYFIRGKCFLEMTGALALYTLFHSSACRRYLRAKYTHVFIDEYQDSGLEQNGIFLKLHDLGLIAVAVGDAAQSIFRFSGKDSKYLTGLAGMKDFKTFPLTFNHRCHPSITNYSLRLLDPEVEPLPSDMLHVYELTISGTPASLCPWIDAKISALCKMFDIGNLSEVGILVRNTRTGQLITDNLQTRNRFFNVHPLEDQFTSCSKLFAHLLRYCHSENITAQDIIEEWRPVGFQSHEERYVRRSIQSLRSSQAPPLELFIAVAEQLCPKADSAQSIELLEAALQDDKSSEWFSEPDDDEIQIMTLHKAKGSEFDLVFHLDLDEWVLPGKRPGPGNNFDDCVYVDLEQDRNLHYVGITRARKCCIFARATLRFNARGESRSASPSEFLGQNDLSSYRRSIDSIL